MGVSSTNRVQLFRSELTKQQESFRHRRRRDKRKAFALQVSTVVLSATITVLLGLRVSLSTQELLSNVALVLGALVTVLSAVDAFFDHRALWIERTLTVRKLEGLQRRVEYQLAGQEDGNLDPRILEGLVRRLEQILAEDQRAWKRLRSVDAPDELSRSGIDEPPVDKARE